MDQLNALSSHLSPPPMDPVAQKLHEERQARIRSTPTRRERLAAAVSCTLLVAISAALAVLAPPSAPELAPLLGLIVIYAIFWQIDFEVGPVSTSALQVAFVPMWFAVSPALLPAVTIVAQMFGIAVTAAVDRNPYLLRRLLTSGTFAWYAVGPAIVLAAFGSDPFSLDAVPIYVLALVAQFAFDGTSNALLLAATGGSRTPKVDLLWMWMVDASLAPIGILAALALASSPWAILAVLPLGLLLAQFAKERDERILHAVELSSAYRGTAQLMGDVLEADDAYTGGEHTKGVVGLALALGAAIKLDPRQMRDLEFGALLHDIGKLRVPNEIINKPGKLTDAEWAVIKEHPEHGQEMLDRVGGELSRAGVIVRAHHERWDGGGYPDGLAGEEIPIEARIITVCDSFSAMTTDRSYRKGMDVDEALAELRRCAGTQFDPGLVDVLFRELGEQHPRPVLLVQEPPAALAEAPQAA